MPPAPARFSTTNGRPMLSVSFCANRRACMSVAPPGARPTTTRTGRAGYASCAGAAAGRSAAANAKPTTGQILFTRFLVPPLSMREKRI